ncbi:unnamed protein product [Linum tenue]|uniref:Uncharacterized protein n=1 Tax=Linum tenue TaxID=586396 RepID=A0AAV0L687_9ROSI|nr:unnamed protein product [Linum tenue]
MVLFDFKSDKHFVASSDKTTLHIYELTNPTIHPSRIRKTHWREIANDQGDADEDGVEEEEVSYNGLMFFDGYGKIEGEAPLTKLAQHLTRLRLIVSPQGHIFQDVAELGEHRDFGIHYLRLNDLFNWPDHGVSMASVTMWGRLVLKYSILKREKRSVTNGGVSKEKYEELKKMVSQKDEELENLREEMEEQDREMKMLKREREDAGEQQKAELRELVKNKDAELRKLLKKKDDELQLLKKGEADKLKEKTDKLEELKREKDAGAKLSKEKDEELKTLRAKLESLRKIDKGGEVATAAASKGKILVDSDEWHNLKNDEMKTRQELLKKDEEIKRRLEKEREDKEALQKLKKENQEVMQANAAETRMLRDQVSSLHELEQRRKQTWALTGETRFLSGFIVDAHRRRPVPPETWRNVQATNDHCYTYVPYTAGSSSAFPSINWARVDEEPKDWPPPPPIGAQCQSGQFDKSNWWFMKTYSPEGRLAMVAYYDGSQTCFTIPDYLPPLRLPFPIKSKLFTTTPFFLVQLDGAVKLVFTYRD